MAESRMKTIQASIMAAPPRGIGVLLDAERGPSVRALLGHLLARAGTADFAIRRARLAALDFTASELAGVRRCRVLLGSLDFAALSDAAALVTSDTSRATAMNALYELIASGRAEIRSAGTCRWTPDFAVLQGLPENDETLGGSVCLLGWLGLDLPNDLSDPMLTSAVTGTAAATATAHQFERLWARSYDVLPIVADAIRPAVAR